jgi:hypothetical protein
LKRTLAILFCALLASSADARSLTSSTGTGESAIVPTTARLLAAIACTPFRWRRIGDVERGALEVPIELNGKEFWFQLDTGSPDTMLYGDEPVRDGWAKPNDSYILANDVRIGGLTFSSTEVARYKDFPAGSGTVGLDLLMNHYVVIDYPEKRFCVANRLSFPVDVRKRLRWSAATLKHGKIFLHARVGGEDRDDLFLDTGSSQFPLMVEHALWTHLTGRCGEADADTTITGTQWGKPKVWPGATPALPIEVAGTVLTKPMVFYEEDGFYQKNFGAAGLLGNAAFWNGVLVLDLGPSMRVGTLQS